MRRPLNLGVIEHREHLAPWLERLRAGKLAVDTETTGLNFLDDRVGGLCLAAGVTAVYACGDALGPATRWLGDQVKRRRSLVFHHGKYDLHMLRGTFGLNVTYPVDDTMLASFVLDNRGAPFRGRYTGNGLKLLASAFVDPEATSAEERLREAVIAAGGSRVKGEWKRDVLLAPTRIVGEYGALDAWYTLELDRQFQPRVDHWPQPDGYPSLRSLYETERWLMLALVDMEHRGIGVDVDFFERWRADGIKRRDGVYAELLDIAGKEINWKSTPQLRELIYGDLGVETTRWTEKTKQPSTDEVALAKMKHPIGQALLRFRAVDKEVTAYGDNLLGHVWSDGRIHTNFKQDGARTGRLSCTKPNLQQQARESGVRRGFIPDPGTVFRFADYSQIEMRLAAHYSNDPVLVHGFTEIEGFDVHATMARIMFGVPEPTSQQRKSTKIFNFATLYGAGVPKITSQLISLLTLKEAKRALHELGHAPAPGEPPHLSLATMLRNVYFKKFPGVKRAKYEASDDFETRGYTINSFGRHRFMEEGDGYKAFNSIIQGSAADLAKRGIVNMYRELQQGEGSIALLLQIHDEAVYLSDGDPRTDRRVLELLADTTNFRVPMIADMSGSAKNWQEKEKIEL